MRFLTADYIFPIGKQPIKNGVLAIDSNGFIVDVLSPHNVSSNKKTDYFKGALCPGFINSHCHLELSYLKGKISKGNGLPEFIGEIESIRNEYSQKEIQQKIVKAENEMIKNGIVGVGDICNGNATFKQKIIGRLKYHTFFEALGFHPEKAEGAFEKCKILAREYALLFKNKGFGRKVKIENILKEMSSPGISITPHAPYSASVKLLKKIAREAIANSFILSIHNQESEGENQMFLSGNGKILERLKKLGINTSGWVPTGETSFHSVLKNLPLKNKLLFVHNTFTSQDDLDGLSLKKGFDPQNLFFCFCPKANLYIENRLPDILLFRDKGMKITVGTDSLASNNSLSVLEELKTIYLHFPTIPFDELLTWATINGAEFFGWEKELGSFEKGKRPGVNWIKNLDFSSGKRNQVKVHLTAKSNIVKII